MSQLTLGLKTPPKAQEPRELSPAILEVFAKLRREAEQAAAIA